MAFTADRDRVDELLFRERIIRLVDEGVTEEWWKRTQEQFLLLSLESNEPIWLMVKSQGGNARIGFLVYDFIKSLPVTVNTVAIGYVASAALDIYLAGSRRVALEGADFFIHNVGFNSGSIPYDINFRERLESIVKEADELQKRAVALLSRESHLSEDQAIKLMYDGDHLRRHVSTREAIEIGIVHELVDAFPMRW